MKTLVNLSFYLGSKNERPDDATLNLEPIMLDSIGNIPSIGDHVCFDHKSLEEIAFLVIERTMTYSMKSGDLSIDVNVKVEKQPPEVYNLLVHM